MVNFKKLADRAKSARTVVDQQGGSDALKEKARRMQGIAKGPGSVGDRAKAAAQVAREKPNPAADVPADDAAGPIGGGAAPPKVSEVEEAPPPKVSEVEDDQSSPKAAEGDEEQFRTSASQASEDSVDR